MSRCNASTACCNSLVSEVANSPQLFFGTARVSSRAFAASRQLKRESNSERKSATLASNRSTVLALRPSCPRNSATTAWSAPTLCEKGKATSKRSSNSFRKATMSAQSSAFASVANCMASVFATAIAARIAVSSTHRASRSSEICFLSASNCSRTEVLLAMLLSNTSAPQPLSRRTKAVSKRSSRRANRSHDESSKAATPRGGGNGGSLWPPPPPLLWPPPRESFRRGGRGNWPSEPSRGMQAELQADCCELAIVALSKLLELDMLLELTESLRSLAASPPTASAKARRERRPACATSRRRKMAAASPWKPSLRSPLTNASLVR
mmetsp:Transcript_62750/g.180527  ORF Transcript_62750/g.180527 Transcript_62750/m.180527 type:complete len:324 (-) Transcript_62750:183-1154(-)